MNIKKIVGTLLTINILQFIISFYHLDRCVGSSILGEVNIYIFLSMGLMLLSSLVTIIGLYFATRYKNCESGREYKNISRGT